MTFFRKVDLPAKCVLYCLTTFLKLNLGVAYASVLLITTQNHRMRWAKLIHSLRFHFRSLDGVDLHVIFFKQILEINAGNVSIP